MSDGLDKAAVIVHKVFFILSDVSFNYSFDANIYNY